MLKIIFPLLAVFVLVPQALAISPTDTEEILVVIEAYYDGITRGDADVLDKPSKRHLTGRWILAWATSRPSA